MGSHKKWNMADVFKDFDYDNDGKLTMKEFYRAFRALGLEKRTGEKMEIDKAMFDSFDTNGDGFVSLVEFQEGLLPKTRKKIVDKLDSGWTFDPAKWEESQARHAGDDAFDPSKATLVAAEATAEPAAEAPPAAPAAE